MNNNQPKMITEAQMKHILDEVELFVDTKISKASFKVLAYFGISAIIVVFSLGGLFVKVNNNSDIIQNSVLTVKDKDNLDLKIANLSDKVDSNSANVLKAIDGIKNDIRRIK